MNIIEFAIASILLTLMPGPDIIFVITQSVTQGKKSGIIFAFGLCTGLIFHTSAAALGISLILYNSATLFQIVKYLGATYLIYLGIMAIIHRKKEVFDLDLSNKKVTKRLYSRGILMNILNPKVSLFFLAFLPQFVNTDSMIKATNQMLILGIIFIVQAIIVFTLVSILADKLAHRLVKNPKISKIVAWTKALVFLVIGIEIAINN
ncbi:MAG: LysE family translocator [Bacteroidales bacterium]|nr:LysE family translocator [Bacteroidales bacterium]